MGESRPTRRLIRLVLCVSDVADHQPSVEVVRTGPPLLASAFDGQGNPTKAAIGFARSEGVEVADLVITKTSKGEQIAVRKIEEGQPTGQVLAEVLPGLIERVTFPKTMRWMDLDVRFARPVHWIVAYSRDEWCRLSSETSTPEIQATVTDLRILRPFV